MMTHTQYLLIKLAEEASELAQIALKTAQFGPEERYGGLSKPKNTQRIEAEFNDLLAIIQMLNEDGLSILENPTLIEHKKTKVLNFKMYSSALGMTAP